MSDPRHDMARDLYVAGAQATPGLAATAFTMNGLVAALTAAFLLLQIAYLLWKWRRERRRAQEIDRLMSGPVAKVGQKPPRGVRTPQDE